MLRPRRRPWLIFLWTGVCFFVVQLVLGVAVEVWLPGVRDHEFAAKEESLRERLAEAPGKPLVLVLGSSRPMMGVQAGRLQEEFGPDGPVVFNFGIPGVGPMRQGIFLQRLLAAGLQPDYLLVEVLPPLFNDNGGSSLEESWMPGDCFTIPEIQKVAVHHGRLHRVLRQWITGRLLPCWGHAAGFRRLLAIDDCGVGPEGGTDSHGWLCLFRGGLTKEEIKRRTEKTHRQYAGTFHDYRLASRPSQALDDLLDRCRKERIPVALMVMPEGTTFRSWYPPSMAEGSANFVADVCQRHHLTLINARLWVDDEGFNDSHHMFPWGATQFTDRLAREAFQPVVLPALKERARRVATSPP